MLQTLYSFVLNSPDRSPGSLPKSPRGFVGPARPVARPPVPRFVSTCLTLALAFTTIGTFGCHSASGARGGDSSTEPNAAGDAATRDPQRGGAAGANARCEADYARYAEARDLSQLSQKSRRLAGTTASYAAAGSVAITETLLYTTGGVVLGALVCSPVIAVEAAADSDGYASIECVTRIGTYATIALAAESEYSLTQGVWRATEGLRLESYDDLAAYLLDSVECRIDRDAPGDRKQAGRQLRALRAESGIWPHLSNFTVDRARRLERRASGG